MKWLKDGFPGDMRGSFFITGAPHATGFVNFLRHAHCEGMRESITEEVSAALLSLDESEWEEKEDEASDSDRKQPAPGGVDLRRHFREEQPQDDNCLP